MWRYKVLALVRQNNYQLAEHNGTRTCFGVPSLINLQIRIGSENGKLDTKRETKQETGVSLSSSTI